MALTSDIVSTLVQVALGGAVVSVLSLARRYRQVRKPAAQIWGLRNTRPTHIVTAQDEQGPQAEFTVMVYPAEYLAAVEVRSLLTDVLGRQEINLCTSVEFSTARSLHDNLICIGGPIHNRLTGIVLARLDLPFFFDGFTLVSRKSGKRYDARIEHETGRIEQDIGVAILADSPFNAGSRVALLMGSRTFGCIAASRYLTAQRTLRTNHRQLGGGPVKWAILGVDVVDDFVARTYTLESSRAAAL